MGLFTKKDPDGLPITFEDLSWEAWGKKARQNPVYKRRVLEKLMLKGIERWKEGKLTGCTEDDEGDITGFLMKLEQLQDCYEQGLGGPVDEKACFDCLMLRRELMEEYLLKSQLKEDTVNSMPRIWEDVAFHYMTGAGCEKDAKLVSKYITMALAGWNSINDPYGISGVSLIRRLMSGHPYVMMDAGAYTLMATNLRFRGAEYGAYVMQEIESMAQMEGEVSYKKLGSSLESDLEILNKAAAMGNAYANYRLGMLYLEGKKLPKDQKKAIAYLEKAAETLAEAAHEASVYYEWTDRSASARYKAQQERLEKEALEKYTVEYMKSSTNTKSEDFSAYADEIDEEIDGSVNDTPFNILYLPEIITGPHNVTYRRQSVSSDSADYFSDHGDLVTIHVADIGMTGSNARNSAGYFYW